MFCLYQLHTKIHVWEVYLYCIFYVLLCWTLNKVFNKNLKSFFKNPLFTIFFNFKMTYTNIKNSIFPNEQSHIVQTALMYVTYTYIKGQLVCNSTFCFGQILVSMETQCNSKLFQQPKVLKVVKEVLMSIGSMVDRLDDW